MHHDMCDMTQRDSEYAGSMALQQIIDCDRRIVELHAERAASMCDLKSIMDGKEFAVCRALLYDGIFKNYLLRNEVDGSITITEIDEVK
jgi:hypothetical protein